MFMEKFFKRNEKVLLYLAGFVLYIGYILFIIIPLNDLITQYFNRGY